MSTTTPNQPDTCSLLIVNHIMDTEHTAVLSMARDEAIEYLKRLHDPEWPFEPIGFYFRVLPDLIELHWYATSDERLAQLIMGGFIHRARKAGGEMLV